MNRRTFLKRGVLGGFLAGCYPVLFEPNLVQTNHYTLVLPDLPRSFQGFRLIHLTDVHFGFPHPELFLEWIVRRVNTLKGDAIVCTGDYVRAHNSTGQIDKFWPIWMKLEARHGVFSVLGNHDHWADTERSLYWLERSGQSVRHCNRRIERGNSRLVIGGAGDLWEDHLLVDQAFADSYQSDCRILLSHNPDSVDTHFSTPLSLIVSGHTHGGQVTLPGIGSPVLPVVNKRYSRGLISTPKGSLFISRGIGWTIAPVRFNCYPEIAVLHLRKG